MTTATPVNQWLSNDIADKLCEAVWSNGQKAGKSSTGTSQTALNANTSKLNGGRYKGPPCTHPGCPCPKNHAVDNCWTKEKETNTAKDQKKEKEKRHRAKKVKKKAAMSSSDLETSSNSESGSEPAPTKHHCANKSQVKQGKTQ